MLFAFKKEYKPLIVSGQKTQTVRIWKKCTLREGKVVRSPGLGMLRIDEIAQLKLKDLTEEDALLDGFSSRAELLAALRKIYKLKNEDGATCYRIRFKYLGKNSTGAKARQTGEKPGEPKNLKKSKNAANKKKTSKPAVKAKQPKRSPVQRTTNKAHSKQQTFFPPF